MILSGGFDLSAGAVISLVNVDARRQHGHDADGCNRRRSGRRSALASAWPSGAFNGFFIAFLRMQPIVVTLSTMFILQGVTLLVLDKPGGFVAPSLGNFYMGDAIPNFLPMPSSSCWRVLSCSGCGSRTRALAIHLCAGQRSGISRRRPASGSNGPCSWSMSWPAGSTDLAGVFISAQTGPAIRWSAIRCCCRSLPPSSSAARGLAAGRGGPVGTMFGAYILMIVVNILLVLNVSAYYSTIAEGMILLLAVLAGSMSHGSVLAIQLRAARARFAAYRAGTLPSQIDRVDRRLATTSGARRSEPSNATRPAFHIRHAETLRFALPAFVCLILVIAVTQLWLGHAVLNPGYWNSLLVLSSFLAVLALGQGTVILTGGLDLSVPWTIGLSGIVLAGMVNGSDAALVYALPTVLAMACVIGFANGVGIVYLGISPIVMTLAMNGILQGFALLYSQGTPAGFSSPMLRWFMTGRIAGMTPVVLFIIGFVIFAVLLLGRTAFGRRVYGIGNGLRAAQLSGIAVEKTLILVYILSALCAAVVGILLTGFSGQASLGMGDDYLLPSIAVVVVGGALITGGRGHYLGMLGGVLLLTSLQMLLAGTTLPYATRAILFGLVVLGAVMALRERNTR